MNVITASSNRLVKELNKLNKDTKTRKQRDVFVVEGIRMFREIPVDRILEAYMSESAFDEYGSLDDVKNLMEHAKVSVLSDSVFANVSQTKSPQGCMAVVGCAHYNLESFVGKKDNETYLVLDAIQDPGNMGTILRSAEAAEISAVIIGPGCCDPYNPKAVRSTMGAIFRVPFIQSGDLVHSIGILRENGVIVYGAHLMGDDLYDIKFPDKKAFLIGNEGNGLSEKVAGTADRLLRIPMGGKVESLNAAISATLLSYEAMRQRIQSRQN